MSVWKKLNTQDAFVTSYVAKKRWNASSQELAGLGIRFLPAQSEYIEPDCEFKVNDCSFDVEAVLLECLFDVQAQ